MALALVMSVFVLWSLASWWFGRASILALAPSDTSLAIGLRLNDQTAPFLLEWLSGIPLISDRSLELGDLAPFVRGDIAVFVNKDGRLSVAVRANRDGLPSELLNQFAISSQEQGPFVLLSSTLVPIAGTTTEVGHPVLPSLKNVWLGRVVLPQDGLAGNLYLSDEDLTLELKTPRSQAQTVAVVPDAALALSGLQWGEGGSPLLGLTRMLSAFDGESLMVGTGWDMGLVVRPSEEGLDVLLSVEAPEATTQDIIEELERIGALARPTVSTQTLPDGTKLEEILVQPDLVSVEEISTSLGVSYRVPTRGGASIIAALHDDLALFTNSQGLMESYVADTSQDLSVCEGSSSIDPDFLVDQATTDRLNPQLSLLNALFDDFSDISFEVKKYSTDVHLCRI